MLKIEGKTFMNIQEAVQWLLDNNALPYQCTANYAPLTEIGLGTIVNPSPAKVRIGSLIFFADSKVSTVVGITETGFICSDKYNNLVDDIAYVTNVAINGSGHLITTLSDGQTIDAGIIKQVSSFSINASQHLIATYNDGTTSDLGAIFNGNVNIAGNLTADSIIENMSGYSAVLVSNTGLTISPVYVGVCKNGNKLTFVFAGNITVDDADYEKYVYLCQFNIPSSVADKLYSTNISGLNVLDCRKLLVFDSADNFQNPLEKSGYWQKGGNTTYPRAYLPDLTVGHTYYIRYELTLLLSNSLI